MHIQTQLKYESLVYGILILYYSNIFVHGIYMIDHACLGHQIKQ